MPARLMALSCAAQNLLPFNCGVAWCTFSSCQENVSCLHCDLVIYWPCSPKKGWLGPCAPWQDSQLMLLAKGGTAPCSPVAHLSWGSRIRLLLCLTAWNLGCLPHMCREGNPSSCSEGQALRGSREHRFLQGFPGLTGAAVRRGQLK